MNTLSSRLRALFITLCFFAASGFVLLGAVWALAALPLSLPFLHEFSIYRPHDSVAAVSDLRVIIVLSSAYFAAYALVVLIDMPYCDRMLAIFADVLLMVVAAMWGVVLGYWVMLRLAGFENFLTTQFALSSLICPGLVFVASLMPLHRLRHPFVLRLVVALAFLVAAPVLLVTAG